MAASGLSGSSGSNGFNMGGLLNSLERAVARKPTNAFNMSSMLNSLSSASEHAADIKKKIQRKPRPTPEDEAIALKMGHLQKQLGTEHGRLTRTARKMRDLTNSPANAEERATLELDIKAYQHTIEEITEQLKNPNSIRNSIRRGRSLRRNPNGRRGMSMSPRRMGPSSMGRNRNRNDNESMGRSPSRSRSPKPRSMSRSPRRGGATRKRRNSRKRNN